MLFEKLLRTCRPVLSQSNSRTGQSRGKYDNCIGVIHACSHGIVPNITHGVYTAFQSNCRRQKRGPVTGCAKARRTFSCPRSNEMTQVALGSIVALLPEISPTIYSAAGKFYREKHAPRESTDPTRSGCITATRVYSPGE